MKPIDAAARRSALSRTQIFQSLPPAEIDAISARVAVRRVARNEVVLRRGDANGGMVVIMSGRVRISVVSEDGKEATLGVLGAGEILGEMSLLDGEACSADVTAQEDCVLLVIERGQFLALLRSNSDLCLHLMTMLTKRLRRANSALEDMALLDLPTRLGRLLARLASDYGVPVRSGTRIEVRLSQKDLSTLVGASREKVNKQIRQWEEEGVLSKDSGRMVIADARALPSLH
jgi:CRP/FNR family transcriptional regulator, cyclic AMP receptor protein